MAELTKTLNTRLSLKIDTLENWKKSTIGLLKGEIAIATVAASAVEGLQEPVCMIKIGEDGVKTFDQLDWNFYAKASDVISACKSEDSLKTFINNTLNQTVTDLGDRIDDNAEAIELLNGDENTAGSVAKAIKDAIDALDLPNTYAAKEHEHLSEDITDLDDTIKAYDYATKTEAQGYADAKVASVAAGDASVTIDGTATAPTVAVKLSDDTKNAIELAEDGLKVVIPDAAEYSIVKAENSGDFAAIYNLTKDGVNVGASINIPKDMVVKSGSVVENPDGQEAGTYIELVLQNVDEPIYINVGNLIEYVTSGSADSDMVVIAVSDDHKVTATITDGSVTRAKLAEDVQTSLGKADTALQAADLTELNNKAHTHENKDLLDTYTQTEEDLADAVSKKHAHENATVLDGITADDVATWDAAVQTVSTPEGADGEANGLKAVKTGTDVAISFDDAVTFIFDCGDAGVVSE